MPGSISLRTRAREDGMNYLFLGIIFIGVVVLGFVGMLGLEKLVGG